MRKIFLHFAMTADGMVSNVEQWVSFTDEAMKDTSAYHDTVDAIIFGNNNYAPLAQHSSRRLHVSRTCQAKILQWILARAPGGHFWNMTCGTESICWSIPW